jgi:hypothetical protein
MNAVDRLKNQVGAGLIVRSSTNFFSTQNSRIRFCGRPCIRVELERKKSSTKNKQGKKRTKEISWESSEWMD